MKPLTSHNQRRRVGKSLLLAVLATTVATACGTTLPTDGTARGQLPAGGTGGSFGGGPAGNAAEDSAAPGTTGAAGVPGGPGAVRTTAPVARGGAGATTTGGTTTGATATSGGPITPGSTGPRGTALGVTAKTVKIGIYTVQAFSSVAANVGVNVSTGDQAAQARAVINYINSHGGVAGGRKLVPVIHDFDVAAAASDPNTEYQAACQAWTEDERVYALATPVGTVNDTLYACLSKAKVITSAAGDNKDRRFFSKYNDFFYQATDVNATRMLANEVDALKAAGFFGAKPKIGVLRLDNAAEKAAVEEGLKPALLRNGLKADDEFAFSASSSGGDSATEYQSAVFRFQRNGITHVLFTGGASPLGFGTTADSQKYYPRYGLNSRNSPAALLQGNMSADQLKNSMGMGWQPMNDVDTSRDPGPVSKRAELCLKLLRDAGQDTSVRATALVGLWLCDTIFFIRDSLEKAPDFSPTGFRTGAELLGQYDAASTFRSTYGPGLLHDGARAYRLFAYQTACRCFAYIKPLAKMTS